MTTYRLWPSTNGPSVVSDTSTTDLGTQFNVTQPNVSFDGYWWWCPTSGDTSTADVTFKLWTTTNGTTGTLVSGSTLAGSGTFSAGAWNFQELHAPVPLTQGTSYVASITYTGSSNHYGATSAYWFSGGGAAGITNGPLTAPSSPAATGGIQGSFNEPSTGAIPSTEFNDSNYWLDVQVSTAPIDSIAAAASFTASRTAAVTAIHKPPASRAITAAITAGLTVLSGTPVKAFSVSSVTPGTISISNVT